MQLDLSMPVIVVDDSATMRRIISTLLTQIGYQKVETAEDGGSALQKLKDGNFGLVISDWNMEPMSGYDLLRHIRKRAGMDTIPFIMVTADSKTENVVAAKRAGVSNYIVKPFNAAALKSKITAVFASA